MIWHYLVRSTWFLAGAACGAVLLVKFVMLGPAPLVATFGLATVSAGLLLKAVAQERRRAALLRGGRPAVGTVLDVTRRRLSSADPPGEWESARVRYSFVAPTGEVLTGQTPRLLIRDVRDLEPGTTVVVVYDPADPRHHELDIFGESSETVG
jgi:hypothetical protein